MTEIELKSGNKWPVNTAYCGDNMEFLSQLPDNCLDSVVTDGPYGLKFMGKKWDYDVPSVKFWKECLRVLKPGGHILSFSSTRTYHRMTVNVEDAGFEIRDMISWVYGSGFPKSHNISKALDSIAGVEREVVGTKKAGKSSLQRESRVEQGYRDNLTNCDTANIPVTIPNSDEAKQWDGWGTALKPAVETIVLARKPLSEKTVAQNVLKWGTGGINIDGCRVEGEPHHNYGRTCSGGMYNGKSYNPINTPMSGRFPANFIHDGSEEVLRNFPETKSGEANFRKESGKEKNGNTSSSYGAESRAVGSEIVSYGDQGSASRFFYVAKPSPEERGKENKHPTVKPIALMRYLIRMVTPPGGTMGDFFLGSFTTAIAAYKENINWIGAERPEKDHGSFDMGNKRYQDLTQQILMDFS